MSRVEFGRAMGEPRDARVPPMAPESADEALVTELDGSPLEAERVWPQMPSGPTLLVGLLIVLDTAVRGAGLIAVPGWQHGLSWLLVSVVGLSWLGGIGLLALPAVVLASRPTPAPHSASRRRVLLVAATLLATGEVCVALQQLWVVSLNVLPGASAWLELPARASTLVTFVSTLAFVVGVALVGVALRSADQSRAEALPERRSRLLAASLGLPALVAILVYFALVFANPSRVPVDALAFLPQAFLPASAAWLAWVGLHGRSRFPARRVGWTAAATAGTLWLVVGIGSDVVLSLGLVFSSGWALAFLVPLVLQLLGVLAVGALLLAVRLGVAGEFGGERPADAPPVVRGDDPSAPGRSDGEPPLPRLVRASRPPGPPGRRRGRGIAAAGALATVLIALVAANGLVPSGASHASPTPPHPATPPPLSLLAVPPTTSGEPSVVLDHADYGFGPGGGWSPDGSAYADVAQVSATDTAVHVVSSDGRRLLTLPGQGVAWVDGYHVAVAGPYIGDSGATEVRIHPVTAYGPAAASPLLTLGPPDATVPGRWSSWMLGSGNGAVALTKWSPDAPPAVFSVWTADGGLRGPASGSPASWSPYGTRLAAWLPPASISGRTDGGVVLAATGSPTPGMAALYDAWLRMIVSFPEVTLDTRFGLRWSPDGAWLVGERIPTDTTAGGPVLLPVPRGTEGMPDDRRIEQLPPDVRALGWISGSELLVARAGMLATWQTTPAPGRLVAAVPSGTVARQVPDGTTLMLASGRPIARVSSIGGSTAMSPADDGSISTSGILAYHAQPSGPVGEERAIPVGALPEAPLPPVLGAPAPVTGCRPMDPASVTSGFAVVLSSGSAVSTGMLDGRHLGSIDIPAAPWRQPSTDPLDIPAAAQLTLLAQPPDGGTPWCIGGATVTAAVFSAVNAPPDQQHDLGSISEPAAGLLLAALPEGDWVVRVDVSAQTIDGSTADETAYFRVRAGLPPAPTPVPAGPPAVACATDPVSPPGVSLAVGSDMQAGVIGASTWRGTAVDVGSEPLPSPTVTVDASAVPDVRIAGDACALAWSVGYAAIPSSGGPVLYDILGSLAAQANPTLDPSFARQDRIRLAPIPWGDWVVRADLAFADGQVIAYWRVHVPGPTDGEAQAAARQVAERFERAVYADHDAATAWPLLAPLSQRSVGGRTGWTRLAAQLASDAGSTWFIGSVDQGTGGIKAVFGALAGDVRATADVREAFVVNVDHRRASDGASTFEQIIVAPLLDGSGWRVWLVR